MSITWNDYRLLAERLIVENPHLNVLDLSFSTIRRLAARLPDLDKSIVPSENALYAVQSTMCQLIYKDSLKPSSDDLL